MKAAVAQLAPVFLDRDATLTKVADAVSEAARHGAQLVAFGETLAPAYPIWLSRTGGARFNDPDQKALHARYGDQGVTPAHLRPLARLGFPSAATRGRGAADTLLGPRWNPALTLCGEGPCRLDLRSSWPSRP